MTSIIFKQELHNKGAEIELRRVPLANFNPIRVNTKSK
jgi:hypothetical protein